MLAHRWKRHREGLRERADGHIPSRESSNDRPARRMGERSEHGVERCV
jgi:hypothetical protein